MIYLRWIVSAPFYAGFWFISLLVAPVLPVFAKWNLGSINNGQAVAVEPRLPYRLNWFMTQDNSLLGDLAWKNMEPGHWEFRSKLDSWPRLQAYLGMLGWLWRNPAYGFAVALGIAPDRPVKFYQQRQVGPLFVRLGYLDAGRLKGMFLLSVRVKQ